MHVSAAVTVAAAPPAAPPNLRSALASGAALGTLAFSERGSRSHFWAPVSTATAAGDAVLITADKSFVTSAGYAPLLVTDPYPARVLDVAAALRSPDEAVASQERLRRAWERTTAVVSSRGSADDGLVPLSTP